jgi:heme-degrading monooxygenase HmoA
MDMGAKAPRLGEDQNVHPMSRFKVTKEMQNLRRRLAHAGLAARRSQGFAAFHLLRGPNAKTARNSSHSIWATQVFSAWTKSWHIRTAYQQAGEALTVRRPEFEGFEVSQTIEDAHPPR